MKQYKDNKQILRIVRHLIMHTSFISDLGLYHGKMGILLFFAHYARYTKKMLYNEFAGELLDEIYEEINTNLPVNFESGLCGIGWGIEYLLQNGFMKGDSDEILSEIDIWIMRHNLRRITDNSVQTGLEGMSYYIDKRINSSSRKSTNWPFDKSYISDWQSVASSISIPDDKVILDAIIRNTIIEGDEITSWKYGLNNGCAGYVLRQILI